MIDTEDDGDLGGGTASFDRQGEFTPAGGEQSELEVTPAIRRFSLHRSHQIPLTNTGGVGTGAGFDPADDRWVVKIGLNLDADDKSERHETNRGDDVGERSGEQNEGAFPAGKEFDVFSTVTDDVRFVGSKADDSMQRRFMPSAIQFWCV
jgi:hypothetical protein